MLGAIVGAGLAVRVRPARAEDATAFILRLSHDLPGVVAGACTAAERRRRLAPYLAGVVDEPALARFCLGRYWRLATPEQQRAYVALFATLLLNSVASRIDAYDAGPGIAIGRPEPSAEGTYVPTLITPRAGPPVHMTWLVQAGDAGWRVTDVVAEGVSLRLTERSDTAAFLERNGYNVGLLLQALQRRTASSPG